VIDTTNPEIQPLSDISEIITLRQRIQTLESQLAASQAELRNAQQTLRQEITDRQQLEQQLSHNEQFYQALFNNSNASLFVIGVEPDQQFRVIVQNAANLAVIGLHGVPMQGKLLEEISELSAEQIRQLRKNYIRCIEAKTPILYEEQLVIANTISWWLTLLTPIFSPTGQIYQLIGSSINITERKQIEDAYRTLVDNSLQGLLIIQDDTIMFANEAIIEITGYSIEEMVGKPFGGNRNPIHPEDRERLAQMYQDRIEGKSVPERYVYRNIRKDGAIRVVDVSVTQTNFRGHPAIQAAFLDITDQKQAEAELRSANDQLRQLHRELEYSRDLLFLLFDGFDDGLLLLDQYGQIVTINRRLADLLGETPARLVHRHWHQVCVAMNPPFPGELAMRSLADGKREIEQIQYASSDTVSIYQLQTFPLANEEQQIAWVVLHVSDITETVKLQQRMLENERFVAAGRIAASVAHELNTPLQTMANVIYFIQNAPEEDHHNLLQAALIEIKRAGKIVRQLLNLHRPTTHEIELVDVNALVDRLLLLLGAQIKEHAIRVEYSLADHLLPVYGYSDQLSQVVLNILVNAIDSMPAGGTLEVATEWYRPEDDQGHRIHIIIRDTGAGISEQFIPRIFDAFVTGKPEGTGLGLAISRQIIEQHGGEIQVASTLGIGSTFTIALPIASA
jgi:PAS domain S-box-containing protein